MILAAAADEHGRPVLMLGLSAENVRRMLDGYPVQIDCHSDDVGVEAGIVVWGGWADEAELRDYLTARFDVHEEEGD